MRTTLDIADDVLRAVEDRARRQQRTVGDLLSELAREALTLRYRRDSDISLPKSFHGFEPLPPRGAPVSNELIDRLREEDLG
jgi:hypothetical protein